MSLAAIHLSSHGDPGKIYLTKKEKDFFEPNQTTETGINKLEFNSTDRFYFLKSNIKKYLKELKMNISIMNYITIRKIIAIHLKK